jgi:uncharacterized membrane protein (UPF0182 family)
MSHKRKQIILVPQRHDKRVSAIYMYLIYRSRSEEKIHMNLLKEMFMMNIKAMLAKQAATIQKTK